MRTDLAKTDLPPLILAVLSRQSLHGYAIAREVEKLSQDILHLHEGLLYPALRLLEQDGLVVGEWTPQEKGADRRVYRLTDKGKREVSRHTREMREYTSVIQILLRRTGHAQPA
jgi:PadR family transcriptional regulator PadR